MEVRLVGSKARVAADWNKNTVRQELNGAVLCTRVRVVELEAVHWEAQG